MRIGDDDRTQGRRPLSVSPASGEAKEIGHGRNAATPSEIPVLGLRDVIWRVYTEVIADRVTLIAAGATYYIVLAIFPCMGVLVSVYGLLTDPSDLAKQMVFLNDVLPSGAFDLLVPQLEVLAHKGRSELSLAFAASVFIAFWSATSGIKALFDAMNVAYGEVEKRSLIKVNLLAFGFTLSAIAALVVLIAIVGLVPAILKAL